MEKAFNLHKHQSGKLSFSTDKTTKRSIIRPSDQFQLMIDDFSNCISNIHKLNYENDILKQAFIMDCARKSASQKKLIKIKN